MKAQIESIRQHLASIESLLDELDSPPPANVVELKKPDEVELEGIIGRPQLREVKGKQLFTAGLGVKDGSVTRWHNITAWGTTAKSADILMKGDRVRVVGTFKEDRYLDNQGVMQVREQLVCSLISPVVGASSAITPSRVSANGTT